MKHREEGETRPVPIPPVLVGLLREHIATYGVASDGRLFATSKGGVYSMAAIEKVWREAREFALRPGQVASPLGNTPYALRHACLTTWLNAGVDPPEVAERAGNSIAVLNEVYYGCLDGQAATLNRRIDDALALDEREGADEHGEHGEYGRDDEP